MNGTTDTLLREAVAHHQAGRLNEAVAIYRRVLAGHPDNADAHHLFGVAAMQAGRLDEAETHLSRAVELNGAHPEFLMNYATCLQEKGETEQAIPYYQQSISLRPGNPQALYNLGNALVRAGRAREAIRYYEDAAAADTGNPALHQAIGLACLQTGDTGRGLMELREAVRLAPDFHEAAYNLALALHERGELEEAQRHADALLARLPQHPGVQNLAGMLRDAKGDAAGAEEHYREALRLAPGYPDALVNLGNLARQREDYADAAALFRQALDGDPRFTRAHNNLANALFHLGDREGAFAHYRRAVEIDPGYANGWSSLGVALRAVGDPDGALDAFDRAIEQDPSHPDARMGRAVLHLLAGRFAAGWKDYLHRDSIAADAARFDRGALPADLHGKRILVERDQGLGDEIFFLRFAAELRRRGADVTYLSDPRLTAMIVRASTVDATKATPPTEAPDIRLSVGDLPFVTGMGDDVAPPGPFVIPPLPDKEDALRARLAECGPAPWIAVTWRAGTAGRDRLLFKSAPPDAIAAALSDAPGTVIAVQRAPEDGEVEAFASALGRPVHDFTALNDDLEAMLALMGLVDIYVCVSNTNVHLRAARGRGSHVLVPYPPEFRWMQDGPVSPWFPGSHVYRQSPDGAWDAALDALARGIAAETAG